MSVSEIITLITLIIGLIGAIAALIPVLIKLRSCLREIIKNKDWKKILEIAKTAINTAELTGKEGAEKKEIVINMVKDSCAELGIELDIETLKNLEDSVDDLVLFVNTMAKNKKIAKKKEK